MMSLPCRSNARARLRTSKAVSVPSRDMRSAKRSSNWMAFGIGTKRVIVLLELRDQPPREINHRGHGGTQRNSEKRSSSSAPLVNSDSEKFPQLPFHPPRTSLPAHNELYISSSH